MSNLKLIVPQEEQQTSSLPEGITRFWDHKEFQQGSREWADEIESAINETIDRCLSLEAHLGLEWHRMKRVHGSPADLEGGAS